MAENRVSYLRETRQLSKLIIEHNEELSFLNCPVCYEPYLLPRVLSQCGHTFCQRCLVAILDATRDWSSVSCPECRSVTMLGENAIQGLKINAAIQQVLDGLSQTTDEESLVGVQFYSCPHYFASDLESCPHCEQTFCPGCLLRHSEALRIEITWLLSEIGRRVNFADFSMEYQEESLCKMKFPDEYNDIVNEINDDSLLYLSFEKLTEIHAKLSKQDLSISYLHLFILNHDLNLGVETVDGNLEFSNISNVKNASVKTMIAMMPQPCRIQMAARSGELTEIQESLSTLPEICRTYVVERRDEQSHYLTMLHHAAQRGHLSIVEFLVRKQNANLWLRDGVTGSLPIHLAATQGHVNIVRFIVEHGGKEFVEARNWCGDTSLALAAETGQLDVVKYLIDVHGAIVDSKCHFGSTAFLYACAEGHLGVVSFLVEHGANIYARDCYGTNEMSGIHWAARFGHYEIVEFLLKLEPTLIEEECGEAGNKIIHEAAGHGHLKVLKGLIEIAKVDIETKNRRHWTPLFHACTEGHIDCVKYLVEKGANLFAEAQDGSLPIHSASYYNCIEVVRYLVEHNSELLEAADADGDTPLLIALQEDHDELAEYLKSKGARVLF